MVTNAGAVGSGTAEAQTGAVSNGLSGSYAFGSRGDDNNFNDGVATVGQFTATSGTVTGVQDLMQDGSYFNSNLTGTYAAASNGRVTVSLNSGQQFYWMVNPARAFFLTDSSSQVVDGTADLQTLSSFSSSTLKGQFAMVMDGADLTQFPFNGQVGTLARIGVMQFNGAATVNLSELVNDTLTGTGAQSPGGLGGGYNVSSNGRGTGILSNSNGGLTLVMYAVSGSDAYVLQVDSGTNTSGVIELQH